MTDSEPDGATDAPASVFGRLQAAFFKPPNRPPPVHLDDEETRRRITRIDTTERKWGLGASVVAAVVAVLAELPGVEHPKTTHVAVTAKPKGTNCGGYIYDAATKACFNVHSRSFWVWSLCVLLLFALTLYIAVRLGRRSFLGFAALMNGLAYETTAGPIFGLPFIVLGGWLLIRAWRVQRYGSPTATKATAGGYTPPPRPVRAPRERKRKTDQTTSLRPTPEPSKRYTPKTPRKKRPTPAE